MYVNLEIGGRFDWGDYNYVISDCVQVSDEGKLTDVFFEDIAARVAWKNTQKLFEESGNEFSISITVSNDRKAVEFIIMRNKKQIGLGWINVISWEKIWRA